ncbi:phage integrase family protein [Jatrophihabitans sp. GAS493]|uniref:tyrosine-type recombinase/integrase n=1 Tax=Jatrophihabitans sp. GAS493 TaxID=1907575 RepID=UPI000BB7EF08|nr:tyrosine-type recombinase/integrase [Jatrophihabitans sp. GAS493]SOD73288.1 phage integrase family protein [Jatrophihabitans sp. GAS493]
MATTFDVRVWQIETFEGVRSVSYRVRWRADAQRFKRTFHTKALADGFRADLIASTRRGDAFEVSTGLPASMARGGVGVSWYSFALDYTDLKWPRIAATTRRTHAEALTAVTVLLLSSIRGCPEEQLLRRALKRWAFNTTGRNDPSCPPEVRRALRWVASHTRDVSALSDPVVLRDVLDGLALRLDGTHRSASVVLRWRKIFNNALEYAVDRKLLDANPLPALKWKPPRSVRAIDARSVVNPVQARTLLNAVRAELPSGPRFVALYGCLYFAALRPEEASGLSVQNLALPAVGWGELHLERARPFAGREWTNSGEARDDRELKQRAVGELRVVPSPPELTALLRWHLDEFGTTPDGRLFVGERNREHLPASTVFRTWQRARCKAFTPEAVASPLARTPYDLRHAAVSTWLAAGVPPTQVAAWAGHSVEVLLGIYAKCLDGGAAQMRARVENALAGK